MKMVDEFFGMSEVRSWLPAIMPIIVTLPFHKVLVLIAILATVKDTFNLVFYCVLDLYRRRWGQILPIDFVAHPWGEAVDVEDRVLVHRWWKAQTISELARAFENFVGAELPRS